MTRPTIGARLAELGWLLATEADPSPRTRALARHCLLGLPTAAPSGPADGPADTLPAGALRDLLARRTLDADLTLADAYRAGTLFGELAAPVGTAAELTERLSPERTTALTDTLPALDDLLPRGVAAALATSLRRWAERAGGPRTGEELVAVWPEQTARWQSALGGHVDAEALLPAGHWTTLTGRLAHHRQAALVAVAGQLGVPLGILGLLVVAVVLTAVAVSGGVAIAAVCLAAVTLAVLGAGWLVLPTADRALAELAPRLVDRELADALADRLTILPPHSLTPARPPAAERVGEPAGAAPAPPAPPAAPAPPPPPAPPASAAAPPFVEPEVVAPPPAVEPEVLAPPPADPAADTVVLRRMPPRREPSGGDPGAGTDIFGPR